MLPELLPLSGNATSTAARTGRVRTSVRAFADDGGAWNPVGASLFWALWGERNDPDRLDRNLAYIARRGFDFVRILGMVGSASWSDRVIGPFGPNYWPTVDALFARLARHGLRASVSVFGDAQVMMPGAADRRAFAIRWAEYGEAHADQVIYEEVANEHALNGLDLVETRTLGRLMRLVTDVPIALSAPSEEEVTTMYGGWPGIATLHYERRHDERGWRNGRQPYGWQDEYRKKTTPHYSGPLPDAAVNQEHVGPGASGVSEDDPLKLGLFMANTFICGNGAYVYHCGGGIRGGGWSDVEKGRKANVDEYDECVGGIVACRELLPAGLANWHRTASHIGDFPFDFDFDGAYRSGTLSKFYMATNGPRQVGALLGIYADVPAKARVAGTWRFHDPRDGAVAVSKTLSVGESFTLPSALSGYLVIGETR